MNRASKRTADVLKVILGAVCGAVLVDTMPPASGDSKQPAKTASVFGEKFWPSEFGADDQQGATNRITPGKVVSAARLIKTGKTYQLGRLYEHGMPLPGKRHFT